MFAKCPEHGNPKTRLQPPLTRLQAEQLHIQLATRTLRVLCEISDQPPTLWLDQSSDSPWLAQQCQQTGCEVKIQQGKDLGERMSNTLADSLQNHRYAILVGSDCPVLKAAHFRDAVQSMIDGSDAVFVPTEDGGYALIGLARHDASLFTGVDWGTDRVMPQARKKLATIGWRWSELEMLWDVDTPEDLQRLRREGISLPPFEC